MQHVSCCAVSHRSVGSQARVLVRRGACSLAGNTALHSRATCGTNKHKRPVRVNYSSTSSSSNTSVQGPVTMLPDTAAGQPEETQSPMDVDQPSVCNEDVAHASTVSASDIPLLCSIFSFPDLSPAHNQSEAAVQYYVKKFNMFIESLNKLESTATVKPDSSVNEHSLWSYLLQPANLNILSSVATQLCKLSIIWKPEFGCAVLPLPGQPAGTLCPATTSAAEPGAPSSHAVGACVGVDELALYLLFLDGWQFNAHSHSTSTTHTSHATSQNVLYCGSIPAASLAQFQVAMAAIISEQKDLKGKKRSNEQAKSGFHRAPAFIYAAVQDAITAVTSPAVTAEHTTSPPEQQGRYTLARGGTTDVGQHTGGIPRDTSWPLVKHGVQVLITLHSSSATFIQQQHQPAEMHLLFLNAMLHFELWLLQGLMQHSAPATLTRQLTNSIMAALQTVTTKAASLAADYGQDMAAVECLCGCIRQQLDTNMAQRVLKVAAKWRLPVFKAAAGIATASKGSSSFEEGGCWTLPAGVVPGKPPFSKGQHDTQAVLQRAANNLGSLPHIPTDPAEPLRLILLKLLQLLQHCSSSCSGVRNETVAMLHGLRSVEVVFFGRVAPALAATALPGGTAAIAPAGLQGLSEGDAQLLAQVVDSYRLLVQAFSATPAAKALMQTDLRSRELLVTWISYCVLFELARSTRRHAAVISQYGVGLKWEDLRHLVLADKMACDAALAVGTYLHRFSKKGCELFNLQNPDATFQAAGQYTARDTSLSKLLQQHQSNACHRVQRHWDEVQRKQRLLASLRSELRRLRLDLESLESAKAHEYNVNGHSSRYYTVSSQVSSKWSQVNNKQGDISAAEQAPEPVIQPLPQSKELAQQWLFFLHMPPLLRYLARASLLAQQLLLPTDVITTATQYITVAGLHNSIAEHYNQYQHSCYCTSASIQQGSDGPAGNVMLRSNLKAPDKHSIGPTSVDYMYSETDGVWWPDGLSPCMAWQGSSCTADRVPGGLFNPFATIPDNKIVDDFTEQISMHDPGSGGLQWAMAQYGSLRSTAATRGNIGICRQDEASGRPGYLSKSGYLELTNLRSYPLRQLHRLCVALREKNLQQALGQPAVQLIIKQTVYHLGTLCLQHDSTTSAQRVAQLWRTGWDFDGGVLQTLCMELQQLAAELDPKPREHEAVLLLGELAAYLSDWHAPCRPIARQFAAMTSRVANQLQKHIDTEEQQGNDAVACQLIAKQCRARMLSLVCYSNGQLVAADAGHMAMLIAQIKHGDIYIEGDPATAAELALLRVRCHDVMCRRLHDVAAMLAAQPDLITKAVSSVLEWVPSNLQWKPPSSSSSSSGQPQTNIGIAAVLAGSQALPAASYQAYGSDGHLYSFNVLDGTVLLDGSPPGRLPLEVVQHRLFVRTFGNVNFQVATTEQGELRTLKSVHGRYYNFYLAAGQDASSQQLLVMTEVDVTQPNRRLELQLLDTGEDGSCGDWGQQLPVRLRELYSHWLCREQQVLVLRPPAFQDHRPQFVIKYIPHTMHDASVIHKQASYICWRVPHHLTGNHWHQLLTEHAVQLSAQQLVLMKPGSCIIHVLSKFESPEFVHTYIPGSSTTGDGRILETKPVMPGTCFHLPRFNMEFELQQSGIIASKDISGYILSQQQQLVSSSGHAAAVASTTSEDASALHYTLPEFHQYLVLEHQPSNSKTVPSVAASSNILAVVPAGAVIRSSQGVADGFSDEAISIQLAASCGASLKAHTYEVHGRFGYLTAPSGKPARLQLAALAAATGSLLPEPGSHATGAQLAMQLLQHSWGNQPLSAGELSTLASVSQMGGYLAPALSLLAHDLQASAAQLQHLHIDSLPSNTTSSYQGGLASEAAISPVDRDAAVTYQLKAKSLLPGGFNINHRLQLPAAQEHWLLQTSGSATPALEPSWWRFDLYNPVQQLPPFPVSSSVVSTTEQQLEQLVVPAGGGIQPRYPLSFNSEQFLEKAMHDELKASWQCHHTHPESEHVASDAEHRIIEMQVSVKQQRHSAEQHLLKHIASIPDNTDMAATSLAVKPRPGASFRLLRLSNVTATPAVLDLLSIALHPGLLVRFNPFLSKAAQNQLYDGVLIWMQLCVLEDRLERLVSLVAAGPEMSSLLIRELQVKRVWDPSVHHKWLVFEVEGRLQIRPAQYHVAKLLMEKPGAITQLNMGEGKTRVILPMLALYWADGTRLVRLHFLSKLLPEALEHMSQVLSASVLGVKLFTQPFHRHVQLTQNQVRAMRAALQYCQRTGGLLLVAPEHRLSLQHKWRELWGDSRDSKGLNAELEALAGLNYLDLLDESDELLHHRYQLVYAVGDPEELPALPERIAAVQGVMRTLCRMVDTGHTIVTDARIAVWQAADQRKPGAMCGLQLLPGEALESATSQLELTVARELMQHAPHELRWLAKHPQQAAILSCITDRAVSANKLLTGKGRLASLSADCKAQLLALRGLLACKLLVHCLQKRHRVDYGVSRLPSAAKRLAVPFRAADTPAERSEFAQPDVALVLTHMAYYSDGLNLPELKAALQVLLRMGANAQKAYYDEEWLPLSKPYIPEDVVVGFDSVAKLDLTHAQQLQLLHTYFSHNQAVVDFFLAHCVLPAECQQYPYRLTGTSWHLADNTAGAVVGFSGTNDHHRLLPLQVCQADETDTQLQGINGKMLDLLVKCATYSTLRPAAFTTEFRDTPQVPLWQTLLDAALSRKVNALLDCGALLAGVDISTIVEHILQHMDTTSYHGVCFYCPSTQGWLIQDTQGRCSSKQASHLVEADCFVLFDDARCRGADLKLRQTAVGLLTVAPALQKDKLMQAAGRLRQLGRGQKLLIMGLPDVTEKIASAATALELLHQAPHSEPCMLQLLQWTMDNTVRGSQAGVMEWAVQGMHFAATKGAPQRALQPEKLQLDDLYGSSKAPEPVGDLLAALADNHRVMCGGSSSTDAADLLLYQQLLIAEVEQRGQQLGQGHCVVAGHGVTEEVERELQQEEEKEEEREVEVPQELPAEEQDWHFSAALAAGSVKELCNKAGGSLEVLKLRDVVRLLEASRQCGDLDRIAWSGKVFCSANFVYTVTSATQHRSHANHGSVAGSVEGGLDEYLRPLDAMLLFPRSGEVLVLSEREADALQEQFCAPVTRTTVLHANNSSNAILLSLAYVQLAAAVEGGGQSRQLLAYPLLSASLSTGLTTAEQASKRRRVLPQLVGVAELVSLMLFNGCAMYGNGEQQKQLQQLMCRKRAAAEVLLSLRGKQALLARSHLEAACDDVP